MLTEVYGSSKEMQFLFYSFPFLPPRPLRPFLPYFLSNQNILETE